MMTTAPSSSTKAATGTPDAVAGGGVLLCRFDARAAGLVTPMRATNPTTTVNPSAAGIERLGNFTSCSIPRYQVAVSQSSRGSGLPGMSAYASILTTVWPLYVYDVG